MWLSKFSKIIFFILCIQISQKRILLVTVWQHYIHFVAKVDIYIFVRDYRNQCIKKFLY
jgi:hypothetical protein